MCMCMCASTNDHIQNYKTHEKLLPTRFELVLLDSKSNVLTTTLWKQKLNNRVQDSHPFRLHGMSLYQNGAE